MRLAFLIPAIVALVCLTASASNAAAIDGRYCVVVSAPTRADPQWKPVVEALVEKHRAAVLTYERSIEETPWPWRL